MKRACLILCIAAGLSLAAAPGVPRKTATPEQIAQLIKQLGDDEFKKREAASKALEAIGEPALPALRKAIASSSDLEVRRRASELVRVFSRRLLAIAARKEIARLQGYWYSISTEANGVRQTGVNKADRHIFTGNRWVVKDGKRIVQAGTIEVIEVGDNLVKLDFIGTAGPAQGTTWLAIYQLKGDELKWCGIYISDGKPRPAALATKPGDGYFLRTLKREKK
jgi:uncharacterized protein (TIGR03067 family)